MVLLRGMSPLLAQSRHSKSDRHMSAFGGKADIAVTCGDNAAWVGNRIDREALPS
jgi:hypothetical protein